MSVVLEAVNSLFGHHSNRHSLVYPDIPHARNARSASQTHSGLATKAKSPMSSHETGAISSSPPKDPFATQRHVSSEVAPQAFEARETSTPVLHSTVSIPPSTGKIKVRDLEHIQSFATEDHGLSSKPRERSGSGIHDDGVDGPQYEISDMKVEHIIEMVAGLLTKITTTNDQQHEHLHRQPPRLDSHSRLDPQTNSVLAFHGKNVPSITILSYLSRINKYCPTSYEVFLSLLVYFDRITERVNARPMQGLRQATEAAMKSRGSATPSDSARSPDRMEGIVTTTSHGPQTITPPSSGSMEIVKEPGRPSTPHSRSAQPDSPTLPQELGVLDQYNLSHFFVVDSFNIHRLVIAGVTCASKFFSGIFYTNSRYAKVSL